MAALEQRRNRNGNESPEQNQNKQKTVGRRVPEVDFEELNFEQRRAPYNSGSRTIGEKEIQKPRQKDTPGN